MDDDEEEETRFIVIPNPNNGKFSIKIEGPMNGPYEVDIKKPFGAIVKELQLVERITHVDLGRGAKGSYIVKIFTNAGVKTIPIYVE
ncbi:MAG: hypothetical protein MK078_10645 [Crocinitomicaceae bacterium]|nr:hypothetical protein [Crocinitomicaceae bacterium]MCH2234697.1 hypothetical protein [Crocinitomicaceae bacterium]